MKFKTAVLFVAAVVLVVGFRLASQSNEKPRVFTQTSLAGGKAMVVGTTRLLVVKATASWCGPCKSMDRAVFTHPDVERWFEAHGVAVAMDIDEHPGDATALGVAAVPTVIVFDGSGREVARSMGVVEADRFIAWLDEIRAGKAGPT